MISHDSTICIHAHPIKSLALTILVLLNDIDAKLRDFLSVKHRKKKISHFNKCRNWKGKNST